MIFPPSLQAGLEWFVEFLDSWIPSRIYTVGGGTVLAARWNHRMSTDIDLFIGEDEMKSSLDERAWDEICDELERLVEESVISELFLRPNGFRFISNNGPMSFFSARRVTRGAVTRELMSNTGVATESTTEIIFKKLRGRMINSSTYVARDLYDVIVAYILDSESLDRAYHHLENLERRSLIFDVQIGDTEVFDLNRVIDPSFPKLTADLDRFNRIAGEVLSQSVTEATQRFLRDVIQN